MKSIKTLSIVIVSALIALGANAQSTAATQDGKPTLHKDGEHKGGKPGDHKDGKGGDHKGGEHKPGEHKDGAAK